LRVLWFGFKQAFRIPSQLVASALLLDIDAFDKAYAALRVPGEISTLSTDHPVPDKFPNSL
jgi:hypothetical protein